MKAMSYFCTFLLVVVVALGFTELISPLHSFLFAIVFFILGYILDNLKKSL